MLLDIMLDAEKQAGASPLPEAPRRFTMADEEVVAQLVDRLRARALSQMTGEI
jgi:hypothetical protein